MTQVVVLANGQEVDMTPNGNIHTTITFDESQMKGHDVKSLIVETLANGHMADVQFRLFSYTTDTMTFEVVARLVQSAFDFPAVAA